MGEVAFNNPGWVWKGSRRWSEPHHYNVSPAQRLQPTGPGCHHKSRGWTIHRGCNLGNRMLCLDGSVGFKRLESVAPAHDHINLVLVLEKSGLAINTLHFVSESVQLTMAFSFPYSPQAACFAHHSLASGTFVSVRP